MALRTVGLARLVAAWTVVASLCASACTSACAAVEKPVDYGREVLPILAQHCFRCHGPDPINRAANLRLDTLEGGVRLLESGRRAVQPGRPAQSELMRRVTLLDDDRMPPPDVDERLTKREVAVLRRWIGEGARWNAHWAYVPPRRPPLPSVSRREWARNAIDLFSLQAMDQRGFSPSPVATRRALIRRLTFALTGLPPRVDEVQAFVADRRPDAYERLVDRLLNSPRYAERMALHWLDLARYADTHGYHTDSHRDMWRWRDVVIASFADNVPFDQFTVEQLAGDLIPNATLRQQIASGFHRNSMINFENGALAEEYLNEYIVDRVNTTATVWLGQTMRCCRCHDHKYDPLTQRDFYQLYAFFNNIQEMGLDGEQGNAQPYIKAPTAAQRELLEELSSELAQTRRQLDERRRRAQAQLPRWERELRDEAIRPPLNPYIHCRLDEKDGTRATNDAGDLNGRVHGPSLWLPGKLQNSLLCGGKTYIEFTDAADFFNGRSFGAWIFVTKGDRAALFSQRGKRRCELSLTDGALTFSLSGARESDSLEMQSASVVKPYQWTHVFVSLSSAEPRGVRVFVDGERVALTTVADSLDGDQFSVSGPLFVGGAPEESSFRGMLDEVRVYRRALSDADVKTLAGGNPLRELLATPAAERGETQRRRILEMFLQQRDEQYNALFVRHQQLSRRQEEILRRAPTTMVMRERADRRTAFILTRGNYRLRGRPVQPQTPAILGELPASSPKNRLALSRWLISPSHPLTARVTVNRFWQLMFGAGLVATPDDFGARGSPPSHPELLDWLAVEFVESGWDVKKLLRLLATSATYRQSNAATAELRRRDPTNRWLTRGPRFRLDAEAIRDNALALANLLDGRVGGPSVFPYQPPGLWREISYNPNDFTAQVYTPSEGRDLYRRSMYTFWKRSAPPPAMAAFDAPTREVCVVQRSRTATPSQVLVLMNDPTFVEASRVLAERLLESAAAPTVALRIETLFQIVLGRSATARERQVLSTLFAETRADYRAAPAEAAKLIRVGERPPAAQDPIELAAWTIVVSTVLNLAETTTPH